MVDRQAKHFSTTVLFYFLFVLRFLNVSSSQPGIEGEVVDIHYCWNGTEEDLSKWRNMSCATGVSTLGNTLSAKILPSGEMDHMSTRSVNGYYCMAFKYFDSSKSQEGGEDMTVQTSTSIYTCDSESICEGKNMMEGYKYYYKGHEGTLYCCNSGNNCNKHGIIQSKKHHHTCYNGEADFKENSPETFTAELEDCHHESRLCMKIVIREPQDGSSEPVKEMYKCDTDNTCKELNLTNANGHSCIEYKTKASPEGQTRETCCCKGDNCYKPAWLQEARTKTVQQGTLKEQNTWQRTVLIILGVALGILFVGVTLFFLRRSIVSTKRNESPTRNTHMAYKSVNSNNDDGVFEDDHVQILTSYK